MPVLKILSTRGSKPSISGLVRRPAVNYGPALAEKTTEPAYHKCCSDEAKNHSAARRGRTTDARPRAIDSPLFWKLSRFINGQVMACCMWSTLCARLLVWAPLYRWHRSRIYSMSLCFRINRVPRWVGSAERTERHASWAESIERAPLSTVTLSLIVRLEA
jgi:hypothetical protein